MAHFFYVHFAFPTYFKNVFEGHVATQFMETRSAARTSAAARTTPAEPARRHARSEASYFGPSYMID